MDDNSKNQPNQLNPLEYLEDFNFDSGSTENLGSFDFDSFLGCLQNKSEGDQEPSQAVSSDLVTECGVSNTTKEALRKCVSLKIKTGESSVEGLQTPQLKPLPSREELQRIEARKERNKISAKNSRLKKEKKMKALEQSLEEKSIENNALQQDVDKCKKYCTALEMALPKIVTSNDEMKPHTSMAYFGSSQGQVEVKRDMKTNPFPLNFVSNFSVDFDHFQGKQMSSGKFLHGAMWNQQAAGNLPLEQSTCIANGSSLYLNSSLPMIKERQTIQPVQQLSDTGGNDKLVTSITSYVNEGQYKAFQVAKIKDYLRNGDASSWTSSIGDDYLFGTDISENTQSRLSQAMEHNGDYDLNPTDQGDIGQVKVSDDSSLKVFPQMAQQTSSQVFAHDASGIQERYTSMFQSRGVFNGASSPQNSETSTNYRDTGLSQNSLSKNESNGLQPKIKSDLKFETSAWHAGMESKEEEKDYNDLVDSF